MLRVLLVLSVFIFSNISLGDDAIIFGLGQAISLSDDDNPKRDYYINAGERRGIKVGQVIKVMRRKPLYDNYSNKAIGDLLVPVGTVKIIHTQPDVSVARVVKLFSRDSLPVLDFLQVMVGDRLELGSATSGTKKNVEKNNKVKESQSKATIPEKKSAKIKVSKKIVKSEKIISKRTVNSKTAPVNVEMNIKQSIQ